MSSSPGRRGSSDSYALPASPTRCRPQHLDRERLRTALRAAEFADVRYHEAVIAATPTTPRSFQLLALAADCIYLFPLASAHAARPTRIALKRVIAVDVASPTLSKQRGLMLEPSCLLFHILVRAARDTATSPKATTSPKAMSPSVNDAPLVEYFVSTFEPNSRVFFCVSQAVETHFQKAVLQSPDAAAATASCDPTELAALLKSLISDFVAAPTPLLKSCLLRELAAAGTCNWPLQQRFFADRTLVVQADGSATTGLASLLVHELLALLAGRNDFESESESSSCTLRLDALEYTASLLDVLVRMCNGAQLLPERLRFFVDASLPLDALVTALTQPVRRCRHHIETDDDGSTAQLLVDDVVDLQVALLLELEAMEREANAVDNCVHQHVLTLVLHAPTLGVWLGRLFTRICRSAARATTELRAMATTRGSHWSLALWRNVKLLDALWRAPNAHVDVLAMLLATRVDYLNMYLRASPALEALSRSAVPHVRATSERLARFVAAAVDAMGVSG